MRVHHEAKNRKCSSASFLWFLEESRGSLGLKNPPGCSGYSIGMVEATKMLRVNLFRSHYSILVDP